MALILPSGSAVAAISGRIGDTVYFRSRWGMSARAWAYPVNTITLPRQTARGYFSALVSLFNGITDDMRADWERDAYNFPRTNRLGEVYIPTGLQHFITTGMNLLYAQQLPLLTPAPFTPIQPLAYISCNASQTIAWNFTGRNYDNSPFLPGDHYILISATLQQTAHMTSKFNQYRLINSYSGGVTINYNVFGDWVTTWPGATLTVGKRIFFKAHTVNVITGQASKPCYTSAIITP